MNHGEKLQRKPQPRESSNFISKIFFLFVFKIYKKGFSKDYEDHDLFDVIKNLKAETLGNKLEEEWKTLKKKHKSPSVFQLLWNCYGMTLILFAFLDFIIDTTSTIIRPYALSKLLSYFQDGQTELTRQDAYFYAALMIGITFVRQIFKNNVSFFIAQLGIKIRTALCSFLFRKAMKMTPSQLGDISIGKIVTLITKDVYCFELYINALNEVCNAVINAMVVSYLLFSRVRYVAFSGISLLVISLPFQFWIGVIITRLKLEMFKKTDERLQATQETLSAMRTIKMYVWEKIFSSKISKTRKQEVNLTYKIFFIQFVAIELAALNAHIALYLLLMTCLWQGHLLTANLVYYLVEHFQNLDLTLTVIFPYAVFGMAKVKAALIRIEKVLNAKEIPKEEEIEFTKLPPAINIKNITLELSNRVIFEKVSAKLDRGLYLIMGSVGSGKSVLLKTILHDIIPQEGIVMVQGKLSYAAQEPWLFPSTIKQNIIFGEEYDEARYQQVIKACALVFDFEQMRDGDATIVEDRGINLSKGQQARVNLARTVYKNCDIYLLDNCLATLDANVCSYIFKECIRELLKDKLVVFATHNRRFIKDADFVLFIENTELQIEQINDNNDIKFKFKKKKRKRFNSEDVKFVVEDIVERKVFHEVKKTGKVNLEVYKRYIQLGGGFWIFFGVICTFWFSQYLQSTSDNTLSNWVNVEEKLLNLSSFNFTDEYKEQEANRKYQQRLYSVVTVSLATSYFIRAFAMFFFARQVSLTVHKKMLANIMNAKMQFFDKNFIGNILNRFSKDLVVVDEYVPFVIHNTTRTSFVLIGIVVMIMIVNTDFIIPMLCFALLLILIRQAAIKTTRSLKRLDASVRSPIVGYLNATLEGLTTIRAFKVQQILQKEFDGHLDLHTSVNYTLLCSLKGLSVIIDTCCDLFVIYIILKFLWNDADDVILAGTVGLGLTQANRLSSTLQWGIEQWTEVENHMTSVERVLEYTTIEQENQGNGKKPENWPTLGKVVYQNVSLSYSSNSNEYILKNLNFQINPMEKIGIVGRTGAGKSSVIATLLRLYEVDGHILIDDVDTKTLNLEFLRKNISIIPQDPILFTGTVRENIDPLKSYSDEEIWNAVKTANLDCLIPTLEYQIIDSGSNFSIGQKQLICLARAAVRKNKIIILDEATASMDQETDKIINQTIKTKFQNCTVFTIAHKLQTILGADRVMVLDKGQIKEFDSPENLLKNKTSIFCQMAQKDNIL